MALPFELEDLRSHAAYDRRPGSRSGKPGLPLRLFKVADPDLSWATDMTYIQTCQRGLHLLIPIDML